MNRLSSMTPADSAVVRLQGRGSGLGPPRRDITSPGFGRFNPIGINNEIYMGF